MAEINENYATALHKTRLPYCQNESYSLYYTYFYDLSHSDVIMCNNNNKNNKNNNNL